MKNFNELIDKEKENDCYIYRDIKKIHKKIKTDKTIIVFVENLNEIKPSLLTTEIYIFNKKNLGIFHNNYWYETNIINSDRLCTIKNGKLINGAIEIILLSIAYNLGFKSIVMDSVNIDDENITYKNIINTLVSKDIKYSINNKGLKNDLVAN